jgi:uncharacterized protein YjiS (DUF1127 family)
MQRTKTVNGHPPGLLGRLAGRFHSYFAYAQAKRSLSALDDHLLRDLGISRGEIDFVVRSPERRP